MLRVKNRRALTFINTHTFIVGLSLFLTLSLFVYLGDNIFLGLLDILFPSQKLTLSHFSWHLKETLSYKGVRQFLIGLTLNKKGILAQEWVYLTVISALIVVTITLCFLILNDNNKKETTVSTVAPTKSFIFFIVFFLLWLSLKQILYVLVVPPWQAPDETFYYFKIGLFTKSYDQIIEEVRKSVELFEFKKYTQLGYIPLPENAQNINRQPSLYFDMVNALDLFTGTHESPENLLYKGRVVSSICIVVTSIIVYFLAKQIFICDEREKLARLSAMFVGVHPQFSFIGGGFGADAMSIMLITLTLFFVMLLHKRNNSKNQSILFFLASMFFFALAVSTKSVGLSLVPLIFVSSICIFFKYIIGRQMRTVFWLILLFFGSLTLLLLFDVFDLHSYLNYRVIPEFSYYYNKPEQFYKYDLKNIPIYFVSFWLTYGWMVYKMSIASYVLLGCITGLIIFGVILNWIRCKIKIARKNYLILIFHVFLVFLTVNAHTDAQGRFFLPALGFFSILFSEGIYTLMPLEYRDSGIKIIFLNLIFFSMLIIIGILIPVFYLQG